jgi:F420H(2)-dependent quinone reductase
MVVRLTRIGHQRLGIEGLAGQGPHVGEWRSNPVNLLVIDGNRYLVAPRGQTQWVRNIRVAGRGELVLGRRTEAFAAEEVPDADKPAILRAYLRRWKAEAGVFFGGVGPGSPDADLQRIAPEHPVSRIRASGGHDRQ